ncbi:hypothetical protein R3P38DRAFT_3179160 [Favolaschia claudopus]|uniref:Uncharacterized protein n=1 Tax=Favolaschia claudopus TaxID=2862362 RepID=A0AAW0B248_9AGAR
MRYSTPRPSPSLIPEQRRLDAPRADLLACRASATAPASSSRPLPPPPRRPDALKAKPSPPLKLSTLHTAALVETVDAINVWARLSTLQLNLSEFHRF